MLYMDDLKLFGKNDAELTQLLKIVQSFSNCINMNFNVKKCAKLTIKRGKYCKSENIKLDSTTTIQELEQHQTYKYLGICENAGISHSKMKETIKKEYCRRVRMILKTQLNSGNKIMAINSLAVPVVTYSFAIIDWTSAELKRFDTKTRKLLTCNKAHHPKADVDRMYIKRSEGGRGLLQIEMAKKVAIIGLDKYLNCNDDWMMKCVQLHDNNKKLYSISRSATKYKNDLHYEDTQPGSPADKISSTVSAKMSKQGAKSAALKQLHENWRRKALHGKFPQRCSQADIDGESTFSWLKSSGLKAETEGFIFAAQDQSLKTKNYIANIMKAGTDATCRFCGIHKETIDHLISACPVLAREEYLARHNRVAQYVHWRICKSFSIEVGDKWYEHETPPVVENDQATILWDFTIHTDRTIRANRPDIVVRDKKEKVCLLLDVSVPSDTNTSLKTYEKISKYKDLEIEIAKSWKYKVKTIPIVIGALGVINKSLKKYIKEVPGQISINELQKTTLLGTARILRKALSLNAK